MTPGDPQPVQILFSPLLFPSPRSSTVGGARCHQSVPFPLLQKVKRVVGIELCQEAVEDARVNACNNGESHMAGSHPAHTPQGSTWNPLHGFYNQGIEGGSQCQCADV